MPDCSAPAVEAFLDKKLSLLAAAIAPLSAASCIFWRILAILPNSMAAPMAMVRGKAKNPNKVAILPFLLDRNR